MPRNSITPAQHAAAFKCGMRLYQEPEWGITEAKRVAALSGLNPESGVNFIYNVGHLLRGEVYKRAMSLGATRDYLTWIRAQLGSPAHANAVKALGKHIHYFEGMGKSRCIGLRKIHAEQTVIARLPANPGQRSIRVVAPKVFESLMPDRSVRRLCLERFAHSIELAQTEQPGCWSLTCIERRIRLNVGKIEVLTLFGQLLHVVGFKPDGPTTYLSVPGSFAVDLTPDRIAAGLRRYGRQHNQLVVKASKTAGSSPWARAHSPDALQYIASELGILLPEPASNIGSHNPDRDRPRAHGSLPDIDDDSQVTEGGAKWVVHLRKERRPSIIQRKKVAVRRETGRLACEACNLDFSQRYGIDYCEVHHLTPLSTLTSTTTTRLEDLSILCANCHRAIHRAGRPMPTVAEFRRTIRI